MNIEDNLNFLQLALLKQLRLLRQANEPTDAVAAQVALINHILEETALPPDDEVRVHQELLKALVARENT